MSNEPIHKTITINAPESAVWHVLLDDTLYREWTKPFSATSYAQFEPGWPEDSKVLFLDGEGSGMVSRVAEHTPGKKISFEHLGEVKDGKEDLESPEVMEWQGAHETYSTEESDGVTTLSIDMDGFDGESMPDFSKMWDEALAIVKELAEKE